jgi:Glycosyl hydrolase family 46
VLTDEQEQTAKAIVNIFETGRVRADYANVTLIPGDSGQLTYGRTQTTLASGGLHELIRAYTSAPGAVFRSDLEPFLGALEARDPALNDNLYFRNLLSAAADDPVMRRTQDDFFDRTKWRPANQAAARDGIVSALGTAVVYDSVVHGSWQTLRARANTVAGVASAPGSWPMSASAGRGSPAIDAPICVEPSTAWTRSSGCSMAAIGICLCPWSCAVWRSTARRSGRRRTGSTTGRGRAHARCA